MIDAGFGNRVTLWTDMVEADPRHFIGGGVGLSILPVEIQVRLNEKEFPDAASKQMLGDNIARRLVEIK